MKTITKLLLILTLTTITTHAATWGLQWDANTETNLTTYRVFHSFDSLTFVEIASVPATQTTWDASAWYNADPENSSKDHYFYLVAENSQGLRSGASNIAVYFGRPKPPSDLRILMTQTGSLTLDLDAPRDVDAVKQAEHTLNLAYMQFLSATRQMKDAEAAWRNAQQVLSEIELGLVLEREREQEPERPVDPYPHVRRKQ